MDDLTKRQRMVLNFINRHIQKRGYPPTIREIAENLGVRWTRGIERHLLALEKKGYIVRARDKSRGIKLPSKITGIFVPIIEKSIGGWITQLRTPPMRYMVLDPSIAKDEEAILVQVDKVEGHDLDIRSGDYVLVSSTETFKSGDIAANFIDGEGVVVRRVESKGRPFVRDTIRKNEESIGKVTAVIRLLS